jgi:hypothetical protein
MPENSELDEALKLVLEFCTTDQIKSILRMRKDDDSVRLSAENKKMLIDRNLRDAVNGGAIKLSEVFSLIQNSEENGAQHIWYYRLKPGLSSIITADSVAERLWGRNWSSTVKAYPSLTLKPEDYVFSDFRKSTRKPNDWYLKIYGHALVTRPTGKTEQRNDGFFWREYKQFPLRTVILIRWNSPDLLEIRVDRNESRKRVDEWQKIAWNLIRPALVKDQFRPWDLERAVKRIVVECDKHSALYTFRDAGVFDKDQDILAHFEAVQDQGNLLQSQSTIEAIKSYVSEGGTMQALAITWLSEKTALSKELRVLAKVKESNEMLIAARCTAEDVDHVTDQLRRFSKGTS